MAKYLCDIENSTINELIAFLSERASRYETILGAWNLTKKRKQGAGKNSHLFWLTGYKVKNLIECYFIHRS